VSSVSLAHLAELCVAFRDVKRVPWLEARLAPYRGRLIVAPRASFSIGPADLLLGRLAAVGGRYDTAQDFLEGALSLACALQSLPAQTRCQEALSALRSESPVSV
jgi:hypothetical protein